eukprot:Polyplicarium_translucidae@DN1840_c0_g1_i1.p2
MNCQTHTEMAAEPHKQRAGYAAVDRHVTSGMCVGLGTGSTAKFAVERIGTKLASGELTNITAIPTSTETRRLAEAFGIPLVELNGLGQRQLDVAIDGADEVDVETLNLVKGAGGALFREKIIESWSRKFVVIVDESKLMNFSATRMPALAPIADSAKSGKRLGSTCKIPIEVVAAFADNVRLRLIDICSTRIGSAAPPGSVTVEVRVEVSSGARVVTPDGNNIVDIQLSDAVSLGDACSFGKAVSGVTGVLEHGLFLGMAEACIASGPRLGLVELQAVASGAVAGVNCVQLGTG